MTKLIEEGSDKTIEEIFTQNYFFIPSFQRNFVWNWNKAKKMLKDILSSKNYFIGNIVVHNDISRKRKGIVDGQQRLTIITVILCALRDILEKNEIPNDITQLISKKNITTGELCPILDINSSYPYFRKDIQKIPAGKISNNIEDNLLEKNNFDIIDNIYQKTKEYFENELSDSKNKEKTINEFCNKILNTKVIFISASNMLDSNLIFEILNTGNTPLSEFDLFKNLTYRNLKNLDTEHEELCNKWNIIEKEACKTGINLNDYLYNEMQLFFKINLLTKKSFFGKLSSQIYNGKGEEVVITLNFFNAFRDDLKDFIKIINPLYQNNLSKNNFNNTKDIKNLKLNLHDLIFSLEIKQHISTLYMAYKMYLNGKLSLKNFTNYVLYIEKEHFLFTTLFNIKPSILSHSHNKLKKQIIEHQEDDNYINTIVSNFRFDNLPIIELENFKKLFLDKIYFIESKRTIDNKKLRFVLKKIHCFVNSIETFDCIDFTIEHLVTNNTVSSEKRNCIGNLLLVPKKLNSEELKNKPLLEKLKILKEDFNYKICGMKIDDLILKLEKLEITEENFIDNRTEQLLEILYNQIFKQDSK